MEGRPCISIYILSLFGEIFLNENKEKRFETGWRIYVSQHERTLILNLGRSKDGARKKSGNSEETDENNGET
jgi:hypothetical protein